MRKLLSILIPITALAVVVYAQGTGRPNTLLVKTDANHALVISSAAPAQPYTTTVFNSTTLATDADGNLLVAASGGGTTPPGGSDTQVQFNDSGAFGGDAGFTYNKTTDTITVSNAGIFREVDGSGGGFTLGTGGNGMTFFSTGSLLTSFGEGATYVAVGAGSGDAIYVPGVKLRSDAYLYWASSGDIAATFDTGISRSAAGVVQINSGTPGTIKNLRVEGAQLGGADGKPTCNSTNRGYLWYVAGGAGVADTYEVCTKDVADAYAWRTVF